MSVSVSLCVRVRVRASVHKCLSVWGVCERMSESLGMIERPTSGLVGAHQPIVVRVQYPHRACGRRGLGCGGAEIPLIVAAEGRLDEVAPGICTCVCVCVTKQKSHI